MQMETVLSLGIPADKIILANCCKRPKDLRTAASQGVDLTTFDTVCELQKMARLHPNAAAVLRVRADDCGARCPLGNKYGAEPEHVSELLQVILVDRKNAPSNVWLSTASLSYFLASMSGLRSTFCSLSTVLYLLPSDLLRSSTVFHPSLRHGLASSNKGHNCTCSADSEGNGDQCCGNLLPCWLCSHQSCCV